MFRRGGSPCRRDSHLLRGPIGRAASVPLRPASRVGWLGGAVASRRIVLRVAFAAAVAVLGDPSPVDGQELGVTAEFERPVPMAGGDDPTSSATEVDVRRHHGGLHTLEDAVREVPGARALRSGAWGSATTLSLRGSDGDQVEVLFGDVPLTTPDGGAFDLSTIPLWALDRIEVYRGGAPIWLGVSGVGGVVRLVPRLEGPGVFGTMGIGAFGLAHARAGASVSNGDIAWTTAVGATSSEGDFPYSADIALLDDTDPVERARENAWLRQGSALGHLRIRVGDGNLSMVLLGLERLGGVPGPAVQPALSTRRNETLLLGALNWVLTEGARPEEEAEWRVAASASVGYRRRRLTDLGREIGPLPLASNDEGLRAVARLGASARVADWLELTGVALYTHESLWPRNPLARRPPNASRRDGGSLAVESRLHGRTGESRHELRASARFAILGASLGEIRPERLGETNDVTQLAPTFRLGGAIELTRGLAVSASVATATRPPSVLELFGDRAFLRGETRLRPERAESVDLGAVVRGRSGPLHGHAELRGFLTMATDLIRYFRTSTHEAVPQNVDSATLAGVELGVNGQATRHLLLRGAVTVLGTWTPYLGYTRQLPLRSPITAYGRPTIRLFDVGPLDRIDVWLDVLHVGASFWDPVNSSSLPERTVFGVGLALSVWQDRVRLDLAMRDLFDQRGTDLLGFPLPGRTFTASLTVRSR